MFPKLVAASIAADFDRPIDLAAVSPHLAMLSALDPKICWLLDRVSFRSEAAPTESLMYLATVAPAAIFPSSLNAVPAAPADASVFPSDPESLSVPAAADRAALSASCIASSVALPAARA